MSPCPFCKMRPCVYGGGGSSKGEGVGRVLHMQSAPCVVVVGGGVRL